MNLKIIGLLASVFSMMLLGVQAQDGTLVTNWGSNGAVMASFNLGGANSRAHVVLQTPTGKLLVGGRGQKSNGEYDIAVMRLNADGTPDNTFGNNGVFAYNQSDNGEDYLADMVLLPDGKILIAGYNEGHATYGTKPYLLKLNADGTIDNTFGHTAQHTWQLTNNGSADPNQIFTNVFPVIGNKLVVVGWREKTGTPLLYPPRGGVFYLINAQGDTGYTDLSAPMDFSEDHIITDATIDAEGNIFMSAYTANYKRMRIIKYKFQGGNYQIDSDFGLNGLVSWNNSTQNRLGNAMGITLGDDNAITSCGFYNSAGWNYTNIEDAWFGSYNATDGSVINTNTLRFSVERDRATDIIGLADNKYITAGVDSTPGYQQAAIMRYNLDPKTYVRTYDNLFGTTGRAFWQSGSNNLHLTKILQLADTTILQYGYLETQHGNDTIVLVKWHNSVGPIEREPKALRVELDSVAVAANAQVSVRAYLEPLLGNGSDTAKITLRLQASTDQYFANVNYTSPVVLDTTLVGPTNLTRTIATNLPSGQIHYWRLVANTDTTPNYSNAFGAYYHGNGTLPSHGMEIWLNASTGIDTTGGSFSWKNVACGPVRAYNSFDTTKNRAQYFENNTTASYGAPQYLSNVYLGHPAVRFDRAAQDVLTSDADVDLTKGYTVFVVGRNHQELASNGLFKIAATPNDQNSAVELYWHNANSNGASQGRVFLVTQRFFANLLNASIYGYAIGTTQAGPPLKGSFYILSAGSFTQTNGFIKVEGSAVPNILTTGDFTPRSFFAQYASKMHIGVSYNIPNVASSYLGGDLAEVIVYNRVLTADEKALVTNYLSDKYSNVPLGVEKQTANSNAFRVFPNPTKGQFTVAFDSQKPRSLQVFNGVGQLITQLQTNLQRTDINLSNQPNGMLFVRVLTENGYQTLKLLKE